MIGQFFKPLLEHFYNDVLKARQDIKIEANPETFIFTVVCLISSGKGVVSMGKEIIVSEDVLSIYKKYGLNVENTFQPRTVINVGSLHNHLHTEFNSNGKVTVSPFVQKYFKND